MLPHFGFALLLTERPRGCCLTRPFLGALLSKCPEAEEHQARRGASDHRELKSPGTRGSSTGRSDM